MLKTTKLKWLGCFVVAFVLAMNIAMYGSFSVSAATSFTSSSYQAVKSLDAIVDIKKLETVIGDGTYNCEKVIDISAFNIPYTTTNWDNLTSFIFKEMPRNFHFQALDGEVLGGKITKLKPEYTCTASQYRQMLAKVDKMKNDILKDIKGNKHLSEVEKALLIHDRLALVCEYDYDRSANNTNMYGALVNGKAVCEGYTQAYDYLLETVGIKSYYCGSQQLYHAWNIVFVNKKPYHVDVTWDDYAWSVGDRGVVGKVGHENFLRSSNGIYAANHTANDYDTLPKDTKYDNYVWQNSKTAFQLVDNKLYYIDHESEKLKCLDTKKTLCSVADKWRYSATGYWLNNSCLSSGNGELYYSLSKAVYKYDFKTKTTSVVYKPTLKGYNGIYGLEYRGGKFVCDINSTAPYAKYGTGNAYVVKQAYKPQTVKSVKLPTTSFTYDGKVKSPNVVVKNAAGKTLKKGTDYIVTYTSGRKNVGTYKMTVKMIGKYTGTKTLTFKIVPAKIDKCQVKLTTTTYTYNGSVKTPSVVVKSPAGKTLKRGIHYGVAYASGRKSVGTYKVIIKMRGNYTGVKTLTFKINPPKTGVAKLTAGKKSIEVSITKKTSQVSGYQVQYSTSKSFKSATTKTIASYKTTKLTLKNLKADKTYYVRVRTYKTVNGKKVYSDWSTAKSAKVK